jgi:hypothetical protein
MFDKGIPAFAGMIYSTKTPVIPAKAKTILTQGNPYFKVISSSYHFSSPHNVDLLP